MTRKTLGKLFFYVASASVLIISIDLNVYPAEFVGQERMIFGFSVMIASVDVIAWRWWRRASVPLPSTASRAMARHWNFWRGSNLWPRPGLPRLERDPQR
jgi:hypothetical protein